MTVNPYGIIKCFNIFKDKLICVVVILDFKAVQPFSLDQGMEGFDTSIVIWITGMRIAAFHMFSCFTPSVRDILAASI